MSEPKYSLPRPPHAPFKLQAGMIVLMLLAALSACGKPPAQPVSAPVDLKTVFPADNRVAGWTISQQVETYNRENLYNLVDGQADSFFVYGFEETATQRYQNGSGVHMNAEVWRLATPADAFGLFTAGQAGVPAQIGNEGDADPGRRLAFWQDRYFVSLNADADVADATLVEFGQAIAGKIPTGGEQPSIMVRLPQSGLVERGYIFFHEEMSVQMEVWLGGENLLGLSQETNCVIGRYTVDGATARLMLIEYPSAGQATKGLKALRAGELSDLLVADSRGNLLVAVFGKIAAEPAQTLVQEALK
jgi:hypothetical protein